jgi:hypothetical protein
MEIDGAYRSTLPLGHIVQRAVLFNVGARNDVLAEPASPSYSEKNIEALPRAVRALFEYLAVHEIDYLLVGGLAFLRYIDGRNTEDVDIIISGPDLERIEELIVESRERHFIQGRFRGLRVDGFLTSNPLFEHVKSHHADHLFFQGHRVPCATVEGLLLLKLYALPLLYRQCQFEKVALYETDVMMLLQAYEVKTEALFKTLKSYLSKNDVETLRDIHQEIMERIESRRERFADA